MQSSDVKVIKGLSIATIVLSALAVISALGVLAMMVAFGPLLDDQAIYSQLSVSGDAFSNDSAAYIKNMSYDDYKLGLGLSLGIIDALCVFVALLSGVGLACGILGVRHAENPQKAGLVFGWSIAGAICAILCGRFISAVIMFIIMAFSNRLRRFADVCYTPTSAS